MCEKNEIGSDLASGEDPMDKFIAKKLQSLVQKENELHRMQKEIRLHREILSRERAYSELLKSETDEMALKWQSQVAELRADSVTLKLLTRCDSQSRKQESAEQVVVNPDLNGQLAIYATQNECPRMDVPQDAVVKSHCSSVRGKGKGKGKGKGGPEPEIPTAVFSLEDTQDIHLRLEKLILALRGLSCDQEYHSADHQIRREEEEPSGMKETNIPQEFIGHEQDEMINAPLAAALAAARAAEQANRQSACSKLAQGTASYSAKVSSESTERAYQFGPSGQVVRQSLQKRTNPFKVAASPVPTNRLLSTPGSPTTSVRTPVPANSTPVSPTTRIYVRTPVPGKKIPGQTTEPISLTTGIPNEFSFAEQETMLKGDEQKTMLAGKGLKETTPAAGFQSPFFPRKTVCKVFKPILKERT